MYYNFNIFYKSIFINHFTKQVKNNVCNIFNTLMNILITNPQKADVFAGIFQHIKAFTDNVNIMFEKERMYIQSMDNAHILIFEIILPKSWFDKYEFTTDDNVAIGLSTIIFYRILNAREKTQSIQLVYDPNETDKLSVHFVSDNKTEFDKHFELPLMELESELMEIPPIEYDAEFSIASSNFANIINQLKQFGDTMDVECSEEKIVLYSNGKETGKMFVEINIDDLTTFSINEGENIKLSYSLNYLHNICLYNKISKNIELKLKDSYPLQAVYTLNDDENAKITFYLAPKINEEEE